MVLDGEVNVSCVYSVCVRVGCVAVRLSGVEVDSAAMVLDEVLYSSRTESVCVNAVINSDELSGWMSSVEINGFDCRLLKDSLELTANVCSCEVEPALAVDVVCDWLISEAKLVCVRMDIVDVSLSDSIVDADLVYSKLDDHVVSIDDMCIN